ncbi:MAG: hypothetical protein ACJ8EF_17470 [Bradyrhizobium sp.]|jgi:hypothetical protein
MTTQCRLVTLLWQPMAISEAWSAISGIVKLADNANPSAQTESPE